MNHKRNKRKIFNVYIAMCIVGVYYECLLRVYIVNVWA